MRKFQCKKSYKITMLSITALSIVLVLAALVNIALGGVRNKALFAAFCTFMLLVPAVLVWFCVISFNVYFIFFEDRFEYHTIKNSVTIKAKNLRYYFYRDGMLSVFFVPDWFEAAQNAQSENEAIEENAQEKAVAPCPDEMLLKLQAGGMGFISGAEEILQWFSKNVKIHPDGQAMDDLLEIAQQYDFATIENISDVLKKANFIAKILNIAGFLIGVWTWFFPAPYRLCTFLALTLPIAVLPVLHFSRGFIRFDKKGNSIYPCVCLSPIACTFGLGWRMLNDISIPNVKTFLIFSAIFFALYLTLFLICQKEFSAKKLSDWLSVVLYSFYFAAYSLAAVCAINFLFDFSIPQNNFFAGALGISWRWA